MKVLVLFSVLFIQLTISAQTISIASLQPDSVNYENIHVKRISSDSLSSTFAIWVKLKVKMHKHIYHTEHVYVVAGEANFTIGDNVKVVKKGDLITIPKNTWHGVQVLSNSPLKVLSIQSPQFKGLDRIFKE